MHLLYCIFIVLDLALLGLLPFTFLLKTGRTIYKSKIFYILAFLFFICLAPMVMYIFKADIITIPVIAGCFVVIGQCLFSKGKGALYYQVVYIVGLFAAQALNAVIAQIILSEAIDSLSMNIYLMTCIVLFLKFVIEILYTIMMVHIGRLWYAKAVLPRKQLIGLFMIPIYSIAAIYSMLIIGEMFYLRYGFWLLVIHCVILLGIDVYCMYIYYQFSRRYEMENQMKILNLQNKLQYEYYATMDKRLDDTKKVLHDIKNHLSIVEQLYKNGQENEGGAYVAQIGEMLDRLGIQYYTENKLLNMILNDKMKKAADKSVQVTAQIYHMPLDFIDPLDMTTIFSNLLDNAIRAAAASEGKWLDIKSELFNDMVIIKIKNSMAEKADIKDWENQHFSDNENGHGIGLINVGKAVRKYKGSLDTSQENHIYTAVLMFPAAVK